MSKIDNIIANDAWDNLSLAEKAEMMKVAVRNGITDLPTIRKKYNEFAEGGEKENPPKASFLAELDEAVLGPIMEGIRSWAYPKAKDTDRTSSKKDDVGGTAQRTYLLPRWEQEQIFLRDGYIKGKEGDYGLVRKAVGNRNLPIFQIAPDATTRENLVPINTLMGNYQGVSNFENKYIDEDKQLVHAGAYPYQLYIDGTNGNIFYKAWDLNDYGENSGRLGRKGTFERTLKSFGSKVLDAVGSPTVVTTGFQPVTKLGDYFGDVPRGANLQDLFQDYNADLDIKDYPSSVGAGLDYFMEEKGLHREKINGKYVYTLPEVVVTGRKKHADGGKIHIKPSHRGKFTALKERTGHSASWFKEHGTPAQKKMATFALNARKWKHGDGGYISLFDVDNNIYDGGGFLDWLKGLFSSEPEKKPRQYTYRGKPAEVTRAIYPNKQELKLVPKRQRPNTSKTKEESEKLERQMRLLLVDNAAQKGASSPVFDIPFIPEKSILINGSTTSTNVLDSLAKYAGIHNRNPQLSEHPRKKRNSYGAPRQINMNEMLGLSTQETHNGAMPYFNYRDGDASYNRALGNTNYLTAFGYVPAENLVRNFQYNNANVDRSTPPLLDAFRYYAQGDYNTKDEKHTRDVNAAGKAVWENPAVKDWWELSGKYWYGNGKGPK